jgi:hypothetical protein
MSSTVNIAFVQQFKDNCIHLCQQRGSRLRPYIRIKGDIVGKYTHFERLNATDVVKKTTRHADTPLVDSEHSRRRCLIEDWEWADLVDHQDEIRLLIDPKSLYAQSASMSMGRKQDDLILAAAVGNSYAIDASDASSNIALPSGQKVAKGFGGSNIGLTLAKVRRGKRIMDAAECPSEGRVIVVNAQMLEEMLGITEVVSADYNSVKALVQGELNTFMGFDWIRTELVPWVDETNDVKGAICIQGTGIGLAIGQEIKADIGVRRDKSLATQVYLCMTFGAVRIEEEKVVEIACDMSP